MRRKDRAVTELGEITDILNICKTACVAMVDDGTPYVVPLSYGYEFEGDKLVLYFHCAKEGRKLDIIKQNNAVCFTIFNEGEPLFAETPCNSGYYYSSVIGDGIAVILEDSAEKKRALSIMFEHQTKRAVTFTDEQAASVCVFKIVSENYTGKRKARP